MQGKVYKDRIKDVDELRERLVSWQHHVTVTSLINASLSTQSRAPACMPACIEATDRHFEHNLPVILVAESVSLAGCALIADTRITWPVASVASNIGVDICRIPPIPSFPFPSFCPLFPSRKAAPASPVASPIKASPAGAGRDWPPNAFWCILVQNVRIWWGYSQLVRQ